MGTDPVQRRARGRLSLETYRAGILAGDRAVLARAVTLVESRLEADQDLAAALLDALAPYAGRARRVGITGVPGAGKSTFLEALGRHITEERGERVAVLTIDPSSPVTGGSILGDKTRMPRLSVDPKAFVRPSPAGGHAGGVARRTREAMLLCEAAGYENVIVETVGVGQAELAARGMTDFFLLLLIPGAGDELQGIKRGILEMVDGVLVNKADDGNAAAAQLARSEYAAAMHLFPPAPHGWRPEVATCSARDGAGIREAWEMVLRHRAHLEAGGYLEAQRREQALAWMRDLIEQGLREQFDAHPAVAGERAELERRVLAGEESAAGAARVLLRLFRTGGRPAVQGK